MEESLVGRYSVGDLSVGYLSVRADFFSPDPDIEFPLVWIGVRPSAARRRSDEY